MGWRLLAGGSRRQGNSISSRGGPWCRRRLRGTASSGLGGCSAQCRLGLWDRVVSGHGSLGGVPFWGGGDLGSSTLVTMTTTKFFSSMRYSRMGTSSLRIFPAYISFCPATGKASLPFSASIFSFSARTWGRRVSGATPRQDHPKTTGSHPNQQRSHCPVWGWQNDSLWGEAGSSWGAALSPGGVSATPDIQPHPNNSPFNLPGVQRTQAAKPPPWGGTGEPQAVQ